MSEGRRNRALVPHPVPQLLLWNEVKLSLVGEKQLMARFLARLEPGSLEPQGPAGKPAYPDRWHRLKTGRSLKSPVERSVADTDVWGQPPSPPPWSTECSPLLTREASGIECTFGFLSLSLGASSPQWNLLG